MTEAKFTSELEDLSGKVAIVTGGAAGIGLETTKYLAGKGCKVYVAARSSEKTRNGIKTIQESLGNKGSLVLHHELDLGAIKPSKQSALDFKNRESRLDILINNAGISLSTKAILSPDGYETMFAVNHLGHFVFTMTLLDRLESTAETHGEARIVTVSSMGHKQACIYNSGIKYDNLKTAVPGDGKKLSHIPAGFRRYAESKLANVWFTKQLDKRLQERGVKNVYTNCCHPGVAGGTGLGSGGFEAGGKWLEPVVRFAMKPLNSNIDAAKTQIYLAANKEIKERKVHGEYWAPVWTWRWNYVETKEEKLGTVQNDEKRQQELWEFSEKAVEAAGA